jgi:hypothetical protein
MKLFSLRKICRICPRHHGPGPRWLTGLRTSLNAGLPSALHSRSDTGLPSTLYTQSDAGLPSSLHSRSDTGLPSTLHSQCKSHPVKRAPDGRGLAVPHARRGPWRRKARQALGLAVRAHWRRWHARSRIRRLLGGRSEIHIKKTPWWVLNPPPRVREFHPNWFGFGKIDGIHRDLHDLIDSPTSIFYPEPIQRP